MNEPELRQEICRVGRSLFERGYIHSTAGNISVRLDDGFLITPTDACLGFLDPATLARVDLQGRLVMANPAVCRAFGVAAPEQVLGKTVYEYVPDAEQAEIVHANDMRVMDTGKAETLEQVLTFGNNVRTFISTKSPRLDAEGRVIGLVGIATDISERKKAEATKKEGQLLERPIEIPSAPGEPRP